MKSILPYIPLFVLSAIVLFFAARPKNGGAFRIKHGVGVLLAILGALSLIDQLVISPVTGGAHINVGSLAISVIFVSVGMFLARVPKPAHPKEPTENEALGSTAQQHAPEDTQKPRT